jgi:hypothetical protein
MKIAREFWAYPVPPKHGAVSAYTHKELCPDPNPIHLREVLPDDIQDLDELEKELLDKLYHATREVDEVKYKLGHKIEVLIGLVDFLKSGIEHFTHEEDQPQVEHLMKHADKILKEIEGME